MGRYSNPLQNGVAEKLSAQGEPKSGGQKNGKMLFLRLEVLNY